MAKEEAQIILSEAIQRIKNLISQEKWLEAHRACLEILRFDPENLKIIRLKNNIERKVKKLNVQAIKEDLKSIQPLLKEKKYDELLEHLKELAPYQEAYPPLKRFIKKAEKEYAEKVKESQKDYHAEELKRIQELMSKHEYQEAIRAAQKLRILRVNDTEVIKAVQKIKDEWVDFELQQNKKLLSGEKYEDMLLTLQKVKKIDSRSEKVAKLIESTKKNYQKYKVSEKRDFIYKGIEKTQTLIQLKKYDRAMQASKEILEIDPDNKKAQDLYAKSKRKFSRSTDKKLSKQMKDSQSSMKEQYKKNKEGFIKI